MRWIGACARVEDLASARVGGRRGLVGLELARRNSSPARYSESRSTCRLAASTLPLTVFKPMKLCASSGLVGSIPTHFPYLTAYWRRSIQASIRARTRHDPIAAGRTGAHAGPETPGDHPRAWSHDGKRRRGHEVKAHAMRHRRAVVEGPFDSCTARGLLLPATARRVWGVARLPPGSKADRRMTRRSLRRRVSQRIIKPCLRALGDLPSSSRRAR